MRLSCLENNGWLKEEKNSSHLILYLSLSPSSHINILFHRKRKTFALCVSCVVGFAHQRIHRLAMNERGSARRLGLFCCSV